MGILFLFGALALTALLLGSFLIAAVWIVLRTLFWILLLPFRLLFLLLAIPLLLLKFVVLLIVGALAIAGIALLVPLLPVIVLVFLVWALVHISRRPATT